MLEELDVQTITLTPAASKAVSDILSERKLEGYALRVFLADGGCCGGVSFGMALDNNIRDVDQRMESGGVQLVVDSVALGYLQGARIDFVTDPSRGAGFVVDSPSVRNKAHEHGEDACGCGGSCACNN